MKTVLFERVEKQDVLLTIEDSNILKGAAACCVILSHAVYSAQAEGLLLSKPFVLLEQLGGIGVLIFFFLSGYGIYKGYGEREIGVSFILRRFKTILLPVLLIKLFLLIVAIIYGRIYSLYDILLSFQSDWFVAVILAEYILFYLSWIMPGAEAAKKRIIIDLILNIFLIVLFVVLHMDPKWYNGLLLFPMGMLTARNEKRLIVYFGDRWAFSAGICFTLFILCGILFVKLKGAGVGADLLKTSAGFALSMMLCVISTRIKFHSAVLNYIGIRSLYYYVIHVNLLALLQVSFARHLLGILLCTVVLSELFYRLTGKGGLYRLTGKEEKMISKNASMFLRGIGTFLVILAHYSQWYLTMADGNNIWQLLSKTGRYGVAIFFVVSGYGLVFSVRGGAGYSLDIPQDN